MNTNFKAFNRQEQKDKDVCQLPKGAQAFTESFGIGDKKPTFENQDIINEAMKFQDELVSESSRLPRMPNFAQNDINAPLSPAQGKKSPQEKINS